MSNSIYVEILSQYAHKAIGNIHVSTEDKERLAEAVGWLETYPFYLVSPTEENIDILRQELDKLNGLAIQEQRRTRRFRIKELIVEAKFKHEHNLKLGLFRNSDKYNLNEAKALALQDRRACYFHNRWLLVKACRKESEIIAKAFQDAADSKRRQYHLAKDKAEGKLVASTGG